MIENTGIFDAKEIAEYLKELRKLPTMTPERELEIKKLMLDPNTSDIQKSKLKHEMITSNLKFVITCVKKYQNQGIDFPDLVAEGNTGLLRALETYDWTSSNRFTTYSVHWIKAKVFEALNTNGRTIRIPTNVIQKTLQDAFNNDEPDKVTASINLTKSYDTVLGEDGDTLIDVLYNKDEKLFDEDYDKTNSPSLRDKLLDMLDVLTEKEKEIIMMYYGFNGCKMTLQDIGDEYNLTKERIRQIKETSLRKLRSESKNLFEFLEN